VDVVLVCVSDTSDVEAVLFGPDGVAAGAAPGTLVIDCSTIDPGATRGFAARLAERAIGLVDAPVTGGSEGARNATLALLVGGDTADVERARPVLAAIGRTITHFGPVEAAASHLATLRERLEWVSALARRSLTEVGQGDPARDGEREAWFTGKMMRELRQQMSEADARAYETVARFDLSWRGLARYWRKKEAGATR